MNNKKTRFNIIDFLIVFVIIAICFAVFLRSGLKNSVIAKSSNQEIVFTATVYGVQAASESYFNIGDEIYFDSDKKSIGVISDVAFKHAESYITTVDGKIVKSTIPDRIDVYLTVDAKGYFDESGTFIGGTFFIGSGKDLTAYTKNVSFSMEITDVKVK